MKISITQLFGSRFNNLFVITDDAGVQLVALKVQTCEDEESPSFIITDAFVSVEAQKRPMLKMYNCDLHFSEVLILAVATLISRHLHGEKPMAAIARLPQRYLHSVTDGRESGELSNMIFAEDVKSGPVERMVYIKPYACYDAATLIGELA